MNVKCDIFHSAFEAPDPSYRLVADSVSNFVTEVHRGLKLGVTLNGVATHKR